MNYFLNDLNFFNDTYRNSPSGHLVSTWAFFLYHFLLQRAGSLIISIVKKL